MRLVQELFAFLLLVVFDSNAFTGEKNFLRIRLRDGSLLQKNLPECTTFPGIEVLFNVKGSNVDYLRIENCQFSAIPSGILRNLTKLSSLEVLFNTKLRRIESKAFVWNPHLAYLNLESNSIEYIAPDAFEGLFKRKLDVGSLRLSGNRLQSVPFFSDPTDSLIHLEISSNPINTIHHDAFINVTSLHELHLSSTNLKKLPANLFRYLKSLYYLDVSKNANLKKLHPDVFVGADRLAKINFNGTAIDYLPYKGLASLRELHLAATTNLWDVPNGIVKIATLKVVRVALENRFLCCAFEMKRARVGTVIDQNKLIASKSPCTTVRTATASYTSSHAARTSVHPTLASKRSRIPVSSITTVDPFAGFGDDLKSFGRKRRNLPFEGFLPRNHTSKIATVSPRRTVTTRDDVLGGGETFVKLENHTEGSIICNPKYAVHFEPLHPVECTPQPDDLRPCDDIMGNDFLTSLSWLVSVIALLGNAMVLSVLVLSRRTLTVTKFLLINLSLADLCLALYLFILVSVSSYTHEEYYNYLRTWQFGAGCSLSGFLAVFSSQLSMLILAVITVERYFAIVYAMHFHRRVTMRHAYGAMFACWLFSFVMALLPLVGVNSYKQVALCLPFEVSSTGDTTYITLLLLTNVLFFLFVLLAYIRMYCVVRSPHLDSGPQRNDSEVAKRMALLVFTDFFCWTPIAFVGLMSALGDDNILNIDVKKSKYLLVIFFPINALCNPFLYAVSTTSFKRDVFDLLIRCGLFQDSITKANEGVYTNSVSNKHSTRQSETTVSYQSQISRGSSSKKGKTPLLSKLLVRKQNKMSASAHLMSTTTTISESPTTDRLYPIKTPDDVFFVDQSELWLQSNSEDLKPPSQNGMMALHEIAPLLSKDGEEETTFLNHEEATCDKPDRRSQYDLVDNVEMTGQSDVVTEESSEHDRKTSGFSEYDLSPEAFKRAKESTMLL